MEKINYNFLTSEDQRKIDGAIDEVVKTVTIDGRIDIVLLLATLEQLNERKQIAKEEAKISEKVRKEAMKKQAEEIGKRYTASLNVGDMVTFRYGTNGKQIATLPLEKVGDKTIQVTYTQDMLIPGSKTAKRNIHFDKIVVPESFMASMAA